MAHKPRAPVDPVLRSRARAMRGEPAPAEEKLWAHVRNRRLGGFKFRRQVPLQTFVVDFFCKESKLVVELDGGTHESGRRKTRCELRFWNGMACA